MKRIYEEVLEEHIKEDRQMLFLVGPRQVGKTTTSKEASEEFPKHYYFNWDNQDDRLKIVQGPAAIAQEIGLDKLLGKMFVVVFDEIHKYKRWKDFLKGFFDTYGHKVKIIVTGSARFDVFNQGGDSLMGRYFSYRLHPLSIAEITSPTLLDDEIRLTPRPIAEKDFSALFEFGGFPEPYLKRNQRFFGRWQRLRKKQLLTEEIRDLTKIQEIAQLQVLAELLKAQIGQQCNYSDLAKKIQVSVDTIKRWLETLKAIYFCFTIQPWSKNIPRSLIKEPKVYLWDWAQVEDHGARVENFVASHLLKAIHFWQDRGFGEYGLYYLRDKEKREVDFIVTKNNKPWFLAEVKSSANNSLSKSLYYFKEKTAAPFAFQLAYSLPFVKENAFSEPGPIIVSLRSFLSQLV